MKLTWEGPYQIKKILEDESYLPEGNLGGVYVVTQWRWRDTPKKDNSNILYVGKSEGSLLKRVGDFIADLHGFSDENQGHHTGGQSVREWWKRQRPQPPIDDIYFGWVLDPDCSSCAENRLYDELSPSENKKRPSRCKEHSE